MPTTRAVLRRAIPLVVPLSAAFPSAVKADIGVLTATDTNATLSSSGGVLAISGTPAANDGINSSAALARKAGRALLCELPALTTIPAGSPVIGWGQNPASTDGAVDIGLSLASTTTARILTGTTTIDTVTTGAAPLDVAMVMRGTGGFLLARSGRSGPYTLRWVYNATTAAEYAKLRLAASAINCTVQPFRVVDLPAPWDCPYGPAITRLATPTAGITKYGHTADCVLEFTFTYSSATVGIDFRKVDGSNLWRCLATAGGALNFGEVNTGVSTITRINVAATFTGTNTYRVVIVAVGNVYAVYVNDVLKGTYTDGTSFQTGITQFSVAFAPSNNISEVVAWPRTLNLPNAAGAFG